MEREVGGGIGMGNTCKSMADSCQCINPLQYCKVISLQLIKINGKKKKKKRLWKERIQIMQDFVGQIKLLKVIERRTIELELH